MKTFFALFSLTLFSVPLPSFAEGFKVPKVSQILFNGHPAQPCVQWWTSGACASYASNFDAADRAQVNQAFRALEKKIRELDNKIASLTKNKEQ